MRSPTALAAASVSSLVSSARTTSSSLMRWTGLKKCMPTTCAGRSVAAAISVIDSDEVLRGEDRVRPASARSSSANISILRSHALGHRLDHQVGVARGVVEVGASAASARLVARVGRHLAGRDALLERAADLGHALLEAAGVGVLQDRVVAAERRRRRRCRAP